MSNPSASPPPRPSALYCAPFRLLRPFTLRCTGKRGAAESEGARQTEKSAADGSRVGGVTTCEAPSRHAKRPAGRGRPNRPGAPPRRAPPPSSGFAVAGAPARWCAWGSWDDSGRAVVQICCKGAPDRDRPRGEARNINDSPPEPRRARSSLEPRERLLEVRARGSSDVLAGQVTCSRVTRRSRGQRRRTGRRVTEPPRQPGRIHRLRLRATSRHTSG